MIYDSDCGFCKWSLALLLSADRGQALRPLALGTAEADRLLADLTPDERNASWHLVIEAPAGSAVTGPDETASRRFSAGAAFAPALVLLPHGRIAAALVTRIPRLTEWAYRRVVEHRGLLGRAVPARARRWAGRVIATHGGAPQ